MNCFRTKFPDDLGDLNGLIKLVGLGLGSKEGVLPQGEDEGSRAKMCLF